MYERLLDASVEPTAEELARCCVDNRYPCGGGWIHFRVTDDERFRDIKIMFNAKCE